MLGNRTNLKSLFQKVCRLACFDPTLLIRKIRSLPIYYRNWLSYENMSYSKFPITWKDRHFTSFDRFYAAGEPESHYFLQDIWAARRILGLGVSEHVDVGSRLDGFVGHLLLNLPVTYIDIRHLSTYIDNLHFVRGSIANLPLPDRSCGALSCLHVIEHIGLGCYGDVVDAMGHINAAHELSRVLKPGGSLFVGTPVGRERLCFDAHRIFDPETVVEIFNSLELVKFDLIDDEGLQIFENASFEKARDCVYGCGLFHFVKPSQETES